jgi:hypothetical protein
VAGSKVFTLKLLVKKPPSKQKNDGPSYSRSLSLLAVVVTFDVTAATAPEDKNIELAPPVNVKTEE